MRPAVTLSALCILFVPMNLFWQFPVVPLPFGGEGLLVGVALILQPWAYIIVGPLLTWHEPLTTSLYRFRLCEASIPITLVLAASSAIVYYGLYRALHRIAALRPMLSRAFVPSIGVYFVLLVLYTMSCAYVVFTLKQRLDALG